jgi:hypothetical protein
LPPIGGRLLIGGEGNRLQICLLSTFDVSFFFERRKKMTTVFTIQYPPQRYVDVVKGYLAQPPVPDFMIMKGPYTKAELGVGLKTMSIYEYDESKRREAGEYFFKRIYAYYAVPGLSYSIEEWVEPAEAMRLWSLI